MKPKQVTKPWGWESWFAHGEHYVGKIIFIKKGHRLSLQYHNQKHETVYAHKGKWKLEKAGRSKIMKPGMSEVIPPKVIHRFCSPFEDVLLLEVSTPQIHDVVRLHDDYGRSEPTAKKTKTRKRKS